MLRWLKTNHQVLTAVGAMVVGLAALFIAWDQARVMRAQQHASVYPVLQIDGYQSSGEATASLGLRVGNTGVGPALIESVTIFQDGERRADLSAFLAELPPGYDTSWTALTGRSLASGDIVTPVDLTWQRSDVVLDDLTAASMQWDRWEMEICYCSVFNRCWTTSPVGGARAERIARCERDDSDPFLSLGTIAIDDPQPAPRTQPAETEG